MKKIYGYFFRIIIEKGDNGYMAFAPGVGGVYEEGATEDEARTNAYEAACAILSVRFERNDPITKGSDDLIILTSPPSRASMPKIRNGEDVFVTTMPCAVGV
jgi:predicted RNase H-like HicB family nuclease